MNKPTDSIVLLVVPSYAHNERISRQVHHYLSNTNPAKGSPLFGSIMLGQACYWLTGICFSERLHADSTASFISSSYVPKEPGKCVKAVRDSSAHTSLLQPQIWLSCPNNNFMHSKYNPPAIFQSASFPRQWSQMFFFLIGISKRPCYMTDMRKLCPCVPEAFWMTTIQTTTNN